MCKDVFAKRVSSLEELSYSVCVHIVLYYQNSVVKPCVELVCLLNQVVPKTYSCVAKLIRLGLSCEHDHKPSSPKG